MPLRANSGYFERKITVDLKKDVDPGEWVQDQYGRLNIVDGGTYTETTPFFKQLAGIFGLCSTRRWECQVTMKPRPYVERPLKPGSAIIQALAARMAGR